MKNATGTQANRAINLEPDAKSARLQLYDVVAPDYEGAPGGFGLFVRAESPAAAVAFWRGYYELSPAAEPERVDEIPEGTEAGAIRWENVPMVYGNGRARL